MLKRAELFLNGCLVGRISVKRLMGAWGFGEFAPTVAFAAFRGVYDEWARLMHRDGDAPLQSATALALCRVECAMDRIHAQLLLDDGKWRRIAQLTIDGNLVEWEEHDGFVATEQRLAGAQNVGSQTARAGMDSLN